MASAVWICVECKARCLWLSKIILISKNEDLKNLNVKYRMVQNIPSWSKILWLSTLPDTGKVGELSSFCFALDWNYYGGEYMDFFYFYIFWKIRAFLAVTNSWSWRFWLSALLCCCETAWSCTVDVRICLHFFSSSWLRIQLQLKCLKKLYVCKWLIFK